MNPAVRWAAIGTLSLLGATPAIGQLTFTGRATNRGYPTAPTGPISSTITLTVEDRDTASGYLSIEPPLGGTGSASFHRWADSVFVVTVSTEGDTIAWLGRMVRRRLTGSYRVLGGQSVGQWGEWYLDQTDGTPMKPLSLAIRPFPDSIDVATLIGLSPAASGEKPSSEAKQRGSYLEFLGITVLVGFAFRFVTLVLLIPIGLLAMLLSRASSPSTDIHSAWLNQAALCALYGTLMGLVAAAYVSTRGVGTSWPYALTAFIWTYFALGANASQKQQSRSGFDSWETPEEAAVSRAAAVGLIVGLALAMVAYNWPAVAFVLPGARTFITWTLSVADWMIGFWLVRVVLGVTVLGYVANVGMMVVVGGFMLLYALWSRARDLVAARGT